MKLLKIPVVARISFGLTGLMVSTLMMLSLLGLVPDTHAEALRSRKRFCESAALSVMLMADKASPATMKEYLEVLAERSPDVQSMAVRLDDGTLVVDVGDHNNRWKPAEGEHVAENQIWIPFNSAGKRWGTFESVFVPLAPSNYLSFFWRPEFVHGLMLAAVCWIAFYFYLRFVLRHLDPSQVIPTRVREALNTLAEGLLIVDRRNRIVLANKAFEGLIGKKANQLLGSPVQRIQFVNKDEREDEAPPWEVANQTVEPVTGRLLGVERNDAEDLVFSVSASPILDEKGASRGVLATFEDVTRLEEKKRELSGMVEYLRASSDAIKQQNQELERLATSDPLTSCLNRRAFFSQFETHWKASERYQNPLSAMMVDIDYFKAINDEHGHSMGDEVLRKVGKTLAGLARETDVVCRYGGEEFAILLPFTTLSDAAIAGERVRAAIEALEFSKFKVTASVGLSAHSPETDSPQDLLDQADKCLYVAKRQGRNQVVCWSDVPEDLVVDETQIARTKAPATKETQSVPYHAVTALISALAYRDPRTAEHSRRVADLCVSTAEGLLSLQDSYCLEIAALLHDIGKIGVPDSILLKPGQLTPEEWSVMRRNDTIGIEIIRASFGSPQLTAIVQHCRSHYGGVEGQTNRPVGNQLPLGSRILAIADAYDAMTTEREFRAAMSMGEAFAELRRCAGKQFDPELVERFIATAEDQPAVKHTVFDAVSRDAALAIGTQIERLSQVLDEQDFDTLEAMSDRLESTARTYGAEAIADKAQELLVILDADRDSHSIISTANELLDLCRSSQQSFLSSSSSSSEDETDLPVGETIAS